MSFISLLQKVAIVWEEPTAKGIAMWLMLKQSPVAASILKKACCTAAVRTSLF